LGRLGETRLPAAELQHDYDVILAQEEIHWYQKPIEYWINMGDRNSKIFHTTTVIRRKRNKIHGLHLPNIIWCTDDTTLREEAQKYFKNLFYSHYTYVQDELNDLPQTHILNDKAC
jgi:hypothetical protein